MSKMSTNTNIKLNLAIKMVLGYVNSSTAKAQRGTTSSAQHIRPEGVLRQKNVQSKCDTFPNSSRWVHWENIKIKIIHWSPKKFWFCIFEGQFWFLRWLGVLGASLCWKVVSEFWFGSPKCHFRYAQNGKNSRISLHIHNVINHSGNLSTWQDTWSLILERSHTIVRNAVNHSPMLELWKDTC